MQVPASTRSLRLPQPPTLIYPYQKIHAADVVHDITARAQENMRLWLWLHNIPGLDSGVCCSFPSTTASSPLSGLRQLPNFVPVCSNSKLGSSTLKTTSSLSSYGLSMEVNSLREAIQQTTDEGNTIEANIGKGIVQGTGEGDAEAVEADEDKISSDSGVLCPALDVSTEVRKQVFRSGLGV
jgi:hypothetical protein